MPPTPPPTPPSPATPTTTPPAPLTAEQTRFVPADLDAARWDAIDPLARALLARPVNSVAELEAWLIDRGELEAAIAEAGSLLYINMTCDTEDAAAQQAYTRFVEEVPPAYRPVAFDLDRRQIDLSDRLGLPSGPGQRYEVLTRNARVEAELFRAENVPIQTELSLLAQKYDQVAGAMTVQFEGQERTLPQMARYQEQTDRALRESAWRAVAERRLRDRAAFDSLFDQMVELRHKVAVNAGFPDYAAYAFRERRRFDYTPAHCRAFHDACEKAVVPLVRRVNEERRRLLNLPALRPWDLAVDPRGRPPLRPFTDGRDLQAKTTAVMSALDPRLGRMIASMGDGSNTRGARGGQSLDLDSRKGKAPGGYQANLDRQRRPFIFMNAAGLSGDVATMFHEAGHAFHAMLARHEPLHAYRSTTEEFCEVASMAMELLTLPHARPFYPTDSEYARANRQQLLRTFTILPWIAQVDAFQQWIYTHPTHTQAERTAAWLDLDRRFGGGVDWSGLESVREALWHRQLHIFTHPFYYIEYGIAQLGALQLWLTSLEKGAAHAIDLYMKGLSLGGSRTLPELFAASGLAFDFGAATVQRLVDRVEAELAKWPE
jgi:oligoendopeptidase F